VDIQKNWDEVNGSTEVQPVILFVWNN